MPNSAGGKKAAKGLEKGWGPTEGRYSNFKARWKALIPDAGTGGRKRGRKLIA